MTELFKIDDETAVCSNPGGRFHGWLFKRHPDGDWVSERKLEPAPPKPKTTGADRPGGLLLIPADEL